MKNNIIGLTIGAAVAIIVLASVLTPVMSDATQTESTFHNEGIFDYGIFTPEDDYTLNYDISTGTVTVNDVVVTPIPGVAPGSTLSYSVIATENMLFRFGHDLNGYYMQIIGKTASDTTLVTGGVRGTATITNGALEIDIVKADSTTQHITGAFNEMYAIVPGDDLAVLKLRNAPAYILGDSEIYSTGLTSVSSWSNAFHLEGTLNEGLTITSPNLPTATYENITWNTEAVDGYNDLHLLTSIEFDIIYNGVTTHATYSYFGVPSEVTAEMSSHLASGEIAILNAVPVLVILAVLLGVVGVAVRGSRD